MTQRANLAILLVDDEPNIEEEIKEGFATIGIDADIVYFCPKHRKAPLGGCEIPDDERLDRFDLALIDLELFPLLKNIGYAPEDLLGGTQILPFLRLNAPWLPVIAYSKLFSRDNPRFLSIACGYGFDGHAVRGLFGNPEQGLNRSLWDLILAQARLVRLRANVGCRYDPQVAKSIDVDPIPSLRAELDAGFPGWEQVVQDTFHFSHRVLVQTVTPGWSGARILRAYTTLPPEAGGGEGQWLLKVSNSPRKLQREADAHQRMLCGGLTFARSVPLLWPIVVTHGRTGGIAYQFAHGARNGLELLEAGVSTAEMCARIAVVLKEYYSKAQTISLAMASTLERWCGPRSRLKKAAQVLGDSPISRQMLAIADGSYGNKDTSVHQFQQSLIHGDLHLGNIMFDAVAASARDVLVDFALSDVGPISVDLVTLSVDLLVRTAQSRGTALPTWNDETQPLATALAPIRKAIRLTDGDRLFFDVLLPVRLATCLVYEDIPTGTKDWIKRVLA